MEDHKEGGLEKAEAELEKAEARLKRDIADEIEAESEIEKAKHKILEEEEKRREPLVEFEDVNSLEKVDFRAPWQTKLNAAWNEAATLLKEPRKATDRLQTPEGKDLMPYLELTLWELEERKIVTALKFQIVGPTGGA